LTIHDLTAAGEPPQCRGQLHLIAETMDGE
jgi:hypothetical protein